ncbi:MAG: hypothetical protein ACOCXH_03615 [Cyclobacteriaceae bacterium]
MIRNCLLLGIFMLSFQWLLAQQETFFAQKAQIIIDQNADNFRPPSMVIGDPEKYYWPIAIARFEKYGTDDSVANAYIRTKQLLNKIKEMQNEIDKEYE